ncbi:MAG: hypothetical protein DWQ30_01580 [Acidobacteria bacterium]|nr:MAG: hypothetical protein DWQ30_01580 [Acidobacteriota bacterium]
MLPAVLLASSCLAILACGGAAASPETRADGRLPPVTTQAGGDSADGSEPRPVGAEAVERPVAAPEATGRAGRRAFVDPATLRLVPPPPPDKQTPETFTDPLAFSDEGLEVETLPDGTMKVDLQGRFRQGLYARRGADGEITTDHRPIAPAAKVVPGAEEVQQ